MKKAIVLVILLSILAVTFTATMINVNKLSEYHKTSNEVTVSNNELISGNNSNKNSQTNLKDQKANYELLYDYEKTLDLFSVCVEPAIKFGVIEVNLGDRYGVKKATQISGLKDKKIEEKINNDIVNRYIEGIKELEKSNDINPEEIELSFGLCGNFSNVFSAIGKVGTSNERIRTFIYFNYELVNGERLELDDLFIKDFDDKIIVKQAVYKTYQDIIKYDPFGSDENVPNEAHFDYDKNEWIGTFIRYDTILQDEIEEEKEYNPVYTEYELSKFVNKAYKNKNNFYFYDNELMIYVGELGWRI